MAKSMPDVEQDQREAFLMVRGDAAIVALEQLEANLVGELAAVRNVLKILKDMDGKIGMAAEGSGTGQARARLVSLMRMLYADQTQGLSDDDVIAMVGKQK